MHAKLVLSVLFLKKSKPNALLNIRINSYVSIQVANLIYVKMSN